MSRSDKVLVLNASFEPISHTRLARAIALVARGMAVVHEASADVLRSERHTVARPVVIRLVTYVKARGLHKPALWSRKAVLLRDNYTCVYCSKHATTVEHIIPRSRGGDSTFLNTAAACYRCNHSKRDRTPQEAGMRPLVAPWHPTRAHLLARVAA